MPSAFWDSSALVPLCVRQPDSVAAVSLGKKFEIVTWWAAEVEIASALARLLRMNLLPTLDWKRANEAALELARSSTVVAPSDTVRSTARKIVSNFDLRAADALQLAAALEWCQGLPAGEVFLTADRRLRDAALPSGVDVKSV